MMEHSIYILALPLLSFILLALAGNKMPHKVAGTIGTLSLLAATVLAYTVTIGYFAAGRDAEGIFAEVMPYNFTWLPINETLSIDMGILISPISAMMLVVITTISLMVHIYSLGYMEGERGFQRYYAFLSLFTFSMLGLVVATNIFQMYIFWELVGVSSYLLIGFYYTKPAAIAASKKAFIVTRFADLFFLIGILVYGYYMGTFSFTPDEAALATAGGVLPTALILMFIGGAGKSANSTYTDVHRRCRKECDVPVAHMVARRYGGSDTGIGTHTRCHNGCCRSVPCCTHVPAVRRLCSRHAAHNRICRRFHGALRSNSSLRADRHQTRARILYDITDCIHDGCFGRMHKYRPA